MIAKLQEALDRAQLYADRALGWTQTIEDVQDESFIRAVYYRFSELAELIVSNATGMTVDDEVNWSRDLDNAETDVVHTRLRHALQQVQQFAQQQHAGNVYHATLHVIYASYILLLRSYDA